MRAQNTFPPFQVIAFLVICVSVRKCMYLRAKHLSFPFKLFTFLFALLAFDLCRSQRLICLKQCLLGVISCYLVIEN